MFADRVLRFAAAAKETSWETNPEEYDMAEETAASLFHSLCGQLLPAEYAEIKDAWGDYRRSGAPDKLDTACARVVQRVQIVTAPPPAQKYPAGRTYGKRYSR